MKIEIVQRNYVAKEKLTDLIDKKVQKFEKYLGEGAQAKVVLSKSGSQERYKMEISIKARNVFVHFCISFIQITHAPKIPSLYKLKKLSTYLLQA